MKKIFMALMLCLISICGFGQTKVGSIRLYDISKGYQILPLKYDTVSSNYFIPHFVFTSGKLTTKGQLPPINRLDLGGYLVRRGSNKIFTSIGIGIGTSAISLPLMLCPMTRITRGGKVVPNNRGLIAGGVILGVGGLTSLITLISGVDDLKKAGIILEGGSVTFKFNRKKYLYTQYN